MILFLPGQGLSSLPGFRFPGTIKPVITPTHSTRRGFGALRGLYFFYFAAFGILNTFLNVYYRSIGLTGTQIGWINTLAPLVGIFSGTLWGMLNDRFGRVRLLLLIGAVGGALNLLGISAVRSFVWILPLAGAYSLFSSPLPLLLDTLNLSMLGGAQEHYGRQRIWGSLGFIVATTLAGFILERIGLHWVFTAYALIMLAFCGVLALLPGQPVRMNDNIWGGLSKLVRRPGWLLFMASVGTLWVAVAGYYNFLSVYLVGMGASESLIGTAWSLAAVTELPVMYFSALLLKRLGARRMLIIAFVLYGVRLLFYGIMPSPVWALPIALMHGLTFGFFWVACVTQINLLAPDDLKATSQGMLVAVTNLSTVVGSPVNGVLFDTVGGGALFRGLAVVCLAALGLYLLSLRQTKAASSR